QGPGAPSAASPRTSVSKTITWIAIDPPAAPSQVRAARAVNNRARLDIRGPNPSLRVACAPAMELERQLLREVGRAIADHDLIRDGDRILVAMSGGKDGYGLMVLLRTLQRRAPVRFDLLAVHLDQGHPGYDGAPLRGWLEDQGVPFHILHEDTYSIVTDKIPA